MKKSSAIIDFLLYSNLFIAVVAVAFTVETVVLLNLPLLWHPYLFITFFATLFDYSLHRYVGIRKNIKVLENDIWIKEHPVLFYTLLTGSFLGLIISVFFAKPEVIFFLIPMAFITLSYTLPVFKRNGIFFRLIDLPAAKIILLTSVWSLTTVLLPVIQADRKIFSADIILLAAERWCFVFALAVPFDMRDRESDGLSGLKTLPVLLGDVLSLKLSFIALGLFAVLETLRLLLLHPVNELYSIGLYCSALLTLFVLRKAKKEQSPYYYYGLLDGMILLQAVLIICIYLL